MALIQKNYIEKTYAGWLGKIIGVRHGAPIEGWSYDRIKKVYGNIDDYLVDYKDFAADDDSNGPMFFLRALQDYTYTEDITAEQIGLTWLNYLPYEHGFLWWGGYGKSTEHTAYLNLRNGIMAPRSGSVEQNGKAVAEQIGGQIFIDVWGLIAPGNPELASRYAKKAASVSHGGNGIYGGMFIAACISEAFVNTDMLRIIEAGLSVIPAESEYNRMAEDVVAFYDKEPGDWRKCYEFIYKNYGYDKYPGACHIIPNSAVIILSLLYGKGDFSQTINICNMCGWDTDCNVGNVGTIMGVFCGMDGIDYDKWIKPINDFFVCSSVIGSLNIMDIPWCASYIADLAYKIANETPPDWARNILSGKAAKFHFEFPGSTHGFRVKSDISRKLEYKLTNAGDEAYSGKGSLKVVAKPLNAGDELIIYHKTYYRPADFNDSRYDPSFSPILYPGQTVEGFVMAPAIGTDGFLVCMYVKDGNSDKCIEGEKIQLKPGQWQKVRIDIPALHGACIEELGFKLIPTKGWNKDVTVYLDDIDIKGTPVYSLDFTKERMEVWNVLHREVSQFTYLKGIWELENEFLTGSCCDFGEAYTGYYDWKDYEFEVTLKPRLGAYHNINFRVQGAIRSYAVGLAPDNKLVLYKNNNGYKVIDSKDFVWEHDNEYTLKVRVHGADISVFMGGKKMFTYTDMNNPYISGQIGFSVREGSRCSYKDLMKRNFIL